MQELTRNMKPNNLPKIDLPKAEYVQKINQIGTNFTKEFINFLQKYGIIGLALAVVIGQSVNQIVQSLVSDILTPIINLIIPSQTQQFSELELYGIKYGSFLNNLIQFILILLIIFFTIRYLIVRVLSEEERAKLKIDD